MKRLESFWRSSVRQGLQYALVSVMGVVLLWGTPLSAMAAEDVLSSEEALANEEVLAVEKKESGQGSEAVLGLGSGILTLVYLPAKVAYAALGGIVGGFTYALTGGDIETAQSVWEPSFYGTYVITPEHLRGNKPVRFYGSSPYEEGAYLAER